MQKLKQLPRTLYPRSGECSSSSNRCPRAIKVQGHIASTRAPGRFRMKGPPAATNPKPPNQNTPTQEHKRSYSVNQPQISESTPQRLYKHINAHRYMRAPHHDEAPEAETEAATHAQVNKQKLYPAVCTCFPQKGVFETKDKRFRELQDAIVHRCYGNPKRSNIQTWCRYLKTKIPAPHTFPDSLTALTL